MFMMDLRTRDWTYWVLASAPYAVATLPDPRELLFVNSTGQLHKFSPDYTDDDGTAIASHYLSGFQTLADGLTANVRRFELTGTGTFTHTAYSALDSGEEWTGTAAVEIVIDDDERARSLALQSGKARSLAFKLSATAGVWAVERWTALINAVKSY